MVKLIKIRGFLKNFTLLNALFYSLKYCLHVFPILVLSKKYQLILYITGEIKTCLLNTFVSTRCYRIANSRPLRPKSERVFYQPWYMSLILQDLPLRKLSMGYQHSKSKLPKWFTKFMRQKRTRAPRDIKIRKRWGYWGPRTLTGFGWKVVSTTETQTTSCITLVRKRERERMPLVGLSSVAGENERERQKRQKAV